MTKLVLTVLEASLVLRDAIPMEMMSPSPSSVMTVFREALMEKSALTVQSRFLAL